MKKIILLSIYIFAFTLSINAQCYYSVDTLTKNLNCSDSVGLTAGFCKISSLFSGQPFNLTSIFFPDTNTGYAIGITSSGDSSLILKTINAGSNWSYITPNGVSGMMMSVYFVSADTGYVSSAMGRILKTVDGGANWTVANVSTKELLSLCFTDADTGYVLTSDSGRVMKTINGGLNWTLLPSYSSNPMRSAYFTNANIGYSVGDNGSIMKTINGGLNWTSQNSGTLNSFNSVYFIDDYIGYSVGFNGTILKTTNGGTNWTPIIMNGAGNLWSVYFTNFNNGFVLSEMKTIFRTENGGESWTSYPVVSSGINLYSNYFSDDTTGYGVTDFEIIKISFTKTAFSWQPSLGLNNANVSHPVAKPTISTTYTVSITPNSASGCAPSTGSVIVNILPSSPPEICMVSVRNDKNLIVWEKSLTILIDSFYIWRETDITNIYEKIGATTYADSSIFIDNSSNPLIQSNKYKISVKDECNIESDVSAVAHKVMHLTINQGMGTTWNLIWEPYEGFIVSTYKIYRGTTPNNLVLIGTTSGSSTQYSDNTAPSGLVYYEVQVINPNPCNPSKSYSVSLSNIATNDPSYGISSISFAGNIKLSPNPATNTLYIDGLTITTSAVVYDISGKLILSKPLTTNQIDISSLAKGLYFIKLSTEVGSVVRKFVKE